ncbi:hypothetical protein [Spirosoma sp. KUDC1026]|uniref:hypothetical protein n=1 Tax=Spirosoma sp. KUDC1026 TaxID=2745947 RepID=UPI00159BE21D|nr:hypothetical protein [Spirosoma sp. KUDC1026]QKZ13797.1 hypothetical protein HU175_14620 [Spirosoma sp. KUDC1026]
MDPKQLFIKAEFLYRRVEWVEDWQYIGLETGLEERIDNLLKTIFGSKNIILIRGRRDSAIMSQHEIRQLFLQGLYDADFKIWSSDFTVVLDFNRIGVYRAGKAG